MTGICIRAHTVESRLLHWVVDGNRIFQVDGRGYNRALGSLGGVGSENERANLILSTQFGFDISLVTYCCNFLPTVCEYISSYAISYMSL